MHDNSNTPDQERRRTIGMALFLVGALALALALGARPNAAPQSQFYYPDPTPYVVHNEYNFLSKNCIGWNVSC